MNISEKYVDILVSTICLSYNEFITKFQLAFIAYFYPWLHDLYILSV